MSEPTDFAMPAEPKLTSEAETVQSPTENESHQQIRAELNEFGEAEDACPHCSPTHERPESRPWGVYVAPDRLDGQPTHLVVQPSNGAHVAQSDADWLWQLIRDYRPEDTNV